MSASLSVDLPSNGSVKKFTGASFLFADPWVSFRVLVVSLGLYALGIEHGFLSQKGIWGEGEVLRRSRFRWRINQLSLESFLIVSESHGIHSHSCVNEENMNDAGTKVGPTPASNTPSMCSYANVTSVPKLLLKRFTNTTYGFFLGKLVAYPVMANYVRNTWGKYGHVKSMLNSSNRIFSFPFSSIDGLDVVLENDPWSSYARALIEVQADVELKDNIVVAMPKIGKYPKNIDSNVMNNMKKPSQATRGVPVGPKETYENDDYDFDPLDDDMYEGEDIPDKIQAICDNLDIKVRGRKKK
ncbi:hypothetical protein Tco_0407323 [Tanacetum coccineum]